MNFFKLKYVPDHQVKILTFGTNFYDFRDFELNKNTCTICNHSMQYSLPVTD